MYFYCTYSVRRTSLSNGQSPIPRIGDSTITYGAPVWSQSVTKLDFRFHKANALK